MLGHHAHATPSAFQIFVILSKIHALSPSQNSNVAHLTQYASQTSAILILSFLNLMILSSLEDAELHVNLVLIAPLPSVSKMDKSVSQQFADFDFLIHHFSLMIMRILNSSLSSRPILPTWITHQVESADVI